MKKIVSVAPTWAEADSRAVRAAVSFSRRGYESTLVEGGASQLPALEGIVEIVSMRAVPRPGPASRRIRGVSPAGERSTQDGGASRRAVRLIRRTLGRVLPEFAKRPLREVLRTAYVALSLTKRCLVQPLRHVPNASLYYLHAPYQLPGVLVRAMMNRAPIIYDAHDFYSGIGLQIDPSSLRQRGVAWFFRCLERLCTRRACAVITVSQGVADLIREEFGCACHVVRNCHDFRLDQPPCLGIRAELGLSADDFLIVSVGQAKRGAAIEEAVEALRTLPSHVHLAFLGRAYEERVTGAEDLTDRLHIVCPVKPYEVVPFIRSADIALLLYYPLLANYRHCLPNGFFQAIAAELPLLYPKLPELQRVVEQNDVGIPIDPQDPSSIVAGVRRMLQDELLYKRLRGNAARARSSLSWEREETVLMDLVEQVLLDKST